MRRARATLGAALLAVAGAAAAQAVQVPEPSDKAMSYYYTQNVLWAIGIGWALFVPALFLFTRWSARIRDLAQRVTKRWVGIVFIYLIVYSVLTTLLELPLAFVGEYLVQHHYDLSDQALSKWARDQAIGFAVTIVISTVVLLAVYWLLKRSPRRWWLYSGLLAIPFVFFVVFIAPIWISPLFDKFGPMKDKALEASIVALADRAGIDGARVFEVEKSVDTKQTNAYVTGFFDTKRIVLWDTIIGKLDERQLLAVVGHEMGHYVLHHQVTGLLFTCALILLSLYGAHRFADALMRRYPARFGFCRLDDIASWPLITLVAGAVMLVVSPLSNAFSRHHEHEADRFGLEITHDNNAMARAFVSLQLDNLANPRPNPILHFLRGGHPTLAERVEFANTYKPWEAGRPERYAEHFRK